MILLAAAGFLSMLAQVVILRELVAALFGVELLYVVALGTWLAGTAVGSVLGRRVAARPAVIAGAFLSVGALTIAEVWFIRTAGVLVGAVPGAYLPFPLQVAGILAATIPPSLLCGVLFPPLVRRAAATGMSAAGAYAWECAGAAVGGAIVTAMFWAGLSTLQAAIITGAVAASAALRALDLRRGPRRFGIAVVGAIAAVGVGGYARGWDAPWLRWQYPALVAVQDTPYARIAVTRAGGQLAVFANGALAFDTEGIGAEAFADLAALQHPRPLRALVIGGGVEGVPAALAAHGVAAIDNVEVDQRADALVRAVLGPSGRTLASDTVIRTIYDEPRRVLERSPVYDLILVAMPPPTSGETSRFYTREFFAACRRHLGGSGVLAIRLPGAENFWPPPLVRLVASVAGAMTREFPSISLVPGGTLYAFGSAQALPPTADALEKRLASRGVAPRLMTPPYLRYLYDTDRRGELVDRLSVSADARVNRDAAPVAYGYAAMLWLSKFFPEVAADGAGAAGGAGRVALGAVFVALALGLWWACRTPARAGVGLVGVAGAAAMTLESVALLRYQIANGVMFVNVGALLTCFMAGMAVGARGATAPAVRRRLDASPWLVAAAFLGVTIGVMAMVRWPVLAGHLGTGVLLGLTGLAGGGAFGLVMHERPGDPSRAVSSLYAADVAGGAIGAWLAPLVLVPLLGLDGTAALTAAAGLALVPLCLTLGSARR